MKKKGVQIGSFLITSEGSVTRFVKVASVSGNWSVKFSEDNPQYAFVRMLANDNNKHEYLEAMVKLMYCMDNAVMDLEFMNEFLVAYNELNDRNMAKRSSSSDTPDEDDKAIIEEQRRIYEEQHGG